MELQVKGSSSTACRHLSHLATFSTPDPKKPGGQEEHTTQV